MKNKLIFETNCVISNKLRVYQNKLEIRGAFGISGTVIPFKNINAVDKNIMGEVIVRTSGGEDFKIVPWKFEDRIRLYKLLSKEISK